MSTKQGIQKLMFPKILFYFKNVFTLCISKLNATILKNAGWYNSGIQVMMLLLSSFTTNVLSVLFVEKEDVTSLLDKM